MIQIYYKYTEWEDFQNGMFETKFKNEDELILKAAKLLRNGLDNTIKIKANLIADKIIKVYERKYFEIHTIVGKEMLF